MHVVVLGVGNLLMADDGIGPVALERLQKDWELPPEVTCIDGGVSGMEMLDDLTGKLDHLIILDAVRAGREPASVVVLRDDEVPAYFKMKFSPHQVGLSDVLATLKIMDEAPLHTTIVGVQVVQLFTQMALSPEVEARVGDVIDIVISELRAMGIEAKPRTQ